MSFPPSDGPNGQSTSLFFVVVAHEVHQRETVVGGDEVDRLLRPALIVKALKVAVDGADESFHASVALHESPDRVAVLPVPFRPAAWKIPDVVAAGVPRFGDDLDLLRFGHFRDFAEQKPAPLEAEILAGSSENCRQIESETIDAHVEWPNIRASP